MGRNIIKLAERTINTANKSLQMAADKSNTLSTRAKRLSKAEGHIGFLKQLARSYPFLTLHNLHAFENDIVRIEREIYEEQQLAIERKRIASEQKKLRAKPAKKPKAKAQREKSVVAKIKPQKSKPDVFKYDTSFECLKLPRKKR